MTGITAIGNALARVLAVAAKGDGRRDKVEGMIARFSPDRVFTGLRHVAIDALTARTGGGMMCML